MSEEKKVKKITQYAVYGSLRKGLCNHGVIKGAEYVGETVTYPVYNLYPVGITGGFPAMTHNGTTAVKLEIYNVTDPEMERHLDGLEGYMGRGNRNNFYNKEIINTSFGLAYIYFYNRAEEFDGAESIAHGDWVLWKEEQAKEKEITRLINAENEY